MNKMTSAQLTLIEKLKDEKAADAYFFATIEECKHMDKEDAQKHLIAALEILTKAQGGIGNLVERVGISAQPLYRILSNVILKFAV